MNVRLLVLLTAMLTACSQPPRSTRPTVDDFNEITTAMAQSLSKSQAIARRGPDSDPWIVSIDRVQNLSSDVMTPSEQWALVERVRSALPLRELDRLKNIRFVLPPERVQQMRRDPNAPEFADLASRRQPTHTMTATFRSLTRAQAKRRSDLYYVEFEVVDLRTGQPVWSDRFEFKRAAQGELRD